MVLGIGFLGFGGLVTLVLIVLWIIVLVREANKKQWSWFIFSLIFPPVALVYWMGKWKRYIKL